MPISILRLELPEHSPSVATVCFGEGDVHIALACLGGIGNANSLVFQQLDPDGNVIANTPVVALHFGTVESLDIISAWLAKMRHVLAKAEENVDA